MSLHTWWDSDPAQRYWMEITHRPDEDIGTNLWCPAEDGVWANQLAACVRRGDRVLHWKAWEQGRDPSLVGWSQVTGEPAIYVSDYYGDGTEIATWRVRLDGLKHFRRPPTYASLVPLSDQLMGVKEQLAECYGKPLYFPFVRYRTGGLRAWQGYLTKFPVELFEVVPGIGSARH